MLIGTFILKVIQNLENETWRPIKGHENNYEVSSLGRVKILNRKIPFTNRWGQMIERRSIEKEKKPGINKYGYLGLTLSRDKRKIHYTIHQLVAIAFIPNPENKPTVNHKNGIKTDNTVENLEWHTVIENIRHAHRTGLVKSQLGVKRKYKVLQISRRKPVVQLSLEGVVMGFYLSITDACINSGLLATHIGGCCKGKSKTHGGFRWEYIK